MLLFHQKLKTFYYWRCKRNQKRFNFFSLPLNVQEGFLSLFKRCHHRGLHLPEWLLMAERLLTHQKMENRKVRIFWFITKRLGLRLNKNARNKHQLKINSEDLGAYSAFCRIGAESAGGTHKLKKRWDYV